MTQRKTDVSIGSALQDRKLFGALPAFRDLSTWRNWIVFTKAVYGEALSKKEEEAFCKFTGRSTYHPPAGGWKEAAAIVGRQSGKSRIAALVQTFEAIKAQREPDGTEIYALSICQDQRSSVRTLFRYACAPFETVPMLRETVAAKRIESIMFANGIVLAAYPCRPAAIRGLRAKVIVCDELAYYRNSENFPVDLEMLRAARPCLATTGGRLIILSSPYSQTGALWELHRKHFGRDDSPILIWQASAPEMNPTLPQDYLQRMEEDDPEAYRSEVLGEFRAGVATFLDPEAIQSCVASEVRERPRVEGLRYRGFADPSGGRGDRFATAVAHRDGECAVLDALRFWNPPFNPSGVVEEASAFFKGYGVSEICGDRFSAEFVVEQFRGHGIAYKPSDRDRSQIYLELLPLLNSRRAALLDHPKLLRELRGLERRRGSTGKDRVDHRPGQHDDLANAACGALVLAAASAKKVHDWSVMRFPNLRQRSPHQIGDREPARESISLASLSLPRVV